MIERLLFLDANTLWHRRLAEAVGQHMPTVAFCPRSGLLPNVDFPDAAPAETRFAPITLPRGWGSVLAPLAQPRLARALLKRYCDGRTATILSSPAWRHLARHLRGKMPFIYYCADDYRGYQGWGPDTAEAEAEICQNAEFSVFVSESLRQRAIEDYGIEASATFVSPNATEPRFSGPAADKPAILNDRPGPIVGVLGALSDRLDIAFIKFVAALPNIGTLLIAGPVQEGLANEAWLSDPKIVIAGRIPHESMHEYALAMDAALIPYAESELNFHCSPMRLYDHLATGVPIYALPTCDQVTQSEFPLVTVDTASGLLKALSRFTTADRHKPARPEIFWSSRAERLVQRFAVIGQSAKQTST